MKVQFIFATGCHHCTTASSEFFTGISDLACPGLCMKLHWLPTTLQTWVFKLTKQHHELSKWFLVVNAGFLVFYLLHYNLIVGEIVNDLFRSETSLNGPYYGIHFINIALIAALLYRIIQELKKVEYAKPELQIAYNWIFVSFIVILASSEVHNLSTFLQSSSEKSLASVSSFNLKIILPLLWGILSFVFMYLGMMKGNKHFRIAALALFALTILKLLPIA